MNRSYLFTLPLITVGVLLCSVMNADKSLSQPAAIDFNQLSNGNYRFCSQQPKTTNVTPPDAIIGNCFLFRKQGNQVVGSYYDTRTLGEESLCLRGTLSDRLGGEGLEFIGGIGRQRIPAKAEGSNLVNWDKEGILKVGSAVRVGKRTISGQPIHYRQAILDLKRLYQYNLGNKLPPTRCIR
ncbi:hypothetical protein A0J48_004085 [Sphaerospermopsis aphanizomenoides BCCUSP55]|uniref:hypothetical protein n=1 Tax=Sphaerospermopsis aphanizomenoides TaxID=459663 RepID=UPI001906FCCE|nr:hypothetical protein [Sphaerospermopsis aphanizomenoides]MBK1986727.1 hypothetical protein [Sphaerospermopsis aphanizomenoides BCCUSP55]